MTDKRPPRFGLANVTINGASPSQSFTTKLEGECEPVSARWAGITSATWTFEMSAAAFHGAAQAFGLMSEAGEWLPPEPFQSWEEYEDWIADLCSIAAYLPGVTGTQYDMEDGSIYALFENGKVGNVGGLEFGRWLAERIEGGDADDSH